jgi:hypothetical protein
MTPEPKNIPDLFVKIHGSHQLTKDKIALDVEVAAVDDRGGLSSQPIELTMNDKTHQLSTMENGRARVELIFPVRAGVREQLISRVYGQESPDNIIEIVPSNFETTIEDRVAQEKDFEFAGRELGLNESSTQREKSLKEGSAQREKLLSEKHGKVVASLKDKHQLEIRALKQWHETQTETKLKKQAEDHEQDLLLKFTKEYEAINSVEMAQPLLKNFISLAGKIPHIKTQLENKNKQEAVDFYKNLLRNHPIGGFTIAELEGEIAEKMTEMHLHLDRLTRLLETIKIEKRSFWSKKTTSQTVFYKICEKLKSLKNLNFNQLSKVKIEIFPGSIKIDNSLLMLEYHCNTFGVIINNDLKKNILYEIKEFKYAVERVRGFVRRLSGSNDSLGFSDVDFGLLSEAANCNNPSKKISEAITSNPSGFAQAYSTLYLKENFSNHEDVINFEINRYESMTSKVSDKLVNDVIALTVDIEKHIKAGNYPLAWQSFKDTMRLIKSNPSVVNLLYLEKFESEWKRYITELDRRFSMKAGK